MWHVLQTGANDSHTESWSIQSSLQLVLVSRPLSVMILSYTALTPSPTQYMLGGRLLVIAKNTAIKVCHARPSSERGEGVFVFCSNALQPRIKLDIYFNEMYAWNLHPTTSYIHHTHTQLNFALFSCWWHQVTSHSIPHWIIMGFPVHVYIQKKLIPITSYLIASMIFPMYIWKFPFKISKRREYYWPEWNVEQSSLEFLFLRLGLTVRHLVMS